MVAPIVIAGAAMVAIGAVSAIVQYLNSEEGRRLEGKERKRLNDLIDKLESPRFDTRQLTPPELKVLEVYVPEAAELVYEAAPELVTATGERAMSGKAAQDAALQRFETVSSGDDPAEDVILLKALNDASERARSQRSSILSELERRGASPGSSAFGNMQFQSSNASQGNMYDAAINAAMASLQRRDQATQSAAGLGGNILDFETNLEGRNADIVNTINARNTAARRNFASNRASLANEAQKFNQGNRQRIFEANANALYGAQQDARDLRNKQVEANYNTEASKLNMRLGQSAIPSINSKIQDQNRGVQGVSDAALFAASLYGKNSDRIKTPEEEEFNGGQGGVSSGESRGTGFREYRSPY